MCWIWSLKTWNLAAYTILLPCGRAIKILFVANATKGLLPAKALRLFEFPFVQHLQSAGCRRKPKCTTVLLLMRSQWRGDLELSFFKWKQNVAFRLKGNWFYCIERLICQSRQSASVGLYPLQRIPALELILRTEYSSIPSMLRCWRLKSDEIFGTRATVFVSTMCFLWVLYINN